MPSTFIISDIEDKKFVKFRNEQKRKYGKLDDNTFSFKFTRTAIGTKVEVINNISGDSKDITDYLMW